MPPDGEKQYCWIVICKNRWFHVRHNAWFGHAIPLAETDFYSLLPELPFRFSVRCDQCGKEKSYRPEDVTRFEMYPVTPMNRHPLFD